jgi:subtilisin family serine protease
MKNFYTIVLLAAIFLGQGMQTAFGQNQGKARFNLPPVNLDQVPDDAYEPGKIQVQFREEVSDKLTSTQIRRGPSSQVALGNANLDNLNRRFAVREYKSLLHNMYQQARVPEQARQRHRQYGFHLLYEISLGEGTNVKEAARAFAQLPEVEFAEPVYRKVRIDPVSTAAASPSSSGVSTTVTAEEWKPADTYYSLQYALNNTGQSVNGTTGTAGADISAQEAWAITKGNPQVIVAVIDEGVQYDHPDLAGNMWPGIGIEGTGTIPGGHGTHVAGTIAAVSNNNTGVAGVAGGDGSTNSGVKIMSLDMFGGAYSGNVYALNVYAADNGAAVSQNSWGYTVSGVYNSSDLRGIDYFNTNGGGGILQGGVSIFAAGNDDDNGMWYPSYYSGAFSVASTDNSDVKSSFSNFGTWIDVSAPGSNIASTYIENGYAYMSGTSMACPHVSGVAALVLSYAPGKMTNAQLLELLRNNTDNIDALNPSYAGLLGTGRINAYKALVAAGAFVGGVSAPANLTAQATGSSEISLGWQSNSNNDPVLIAWSENGIFGTPAEGETYSAGQTIPGVVQCCTQEKQRQVWSIAVLMPLLPTITGHGRIIQKQYTPNPKVPVPPHYALPMQPYPFQKISIAFWLFLPVGALQERKPGM